MFVGVLLWGQIPDASAAVLIGKVRCQVLDPGTLREVLGLEVGQRLSMASWDDQTSDLDSNGNYAITQYPGTLDFIADRFKFSPVEINPEMIVTNHLTLEMEGSTEGDRRGELRLRIPASATQATFLGNSRLFECEKIAI